MMKKQIAGVLTFLGIIVLQPTGITQEYPGCFVIDSSGTYRNLAQVCPSSTTFDPNVVPTAPAGTPEVQAGALQVPIKRTEGGTPVVDVIFNGTETFEMLFDTGATGTLITSEMANALNIEPQGTATVTIADGSQVEVDVGVVQSVQVGTLRVGEILVAIAPPALEIGLLGQDIYGNFDYTVKQDAIEFQPRS